MLMYLLTYICLRFQVGHRKGGEKFIHTDIMTTEMNRRPCLLSVFNSKFLLRLPDFFTSWSNNKVRSVKSSCNFLFRCLKILQKKILGWCFFKFFKNLRLKNFFVLKLRFFIVVTTTKTIPRADSDNFLPLKSHLVNSWKS